MKKNRWIEKLYEIVSENMNSAGNAMPFTMELFAYATNTQDNVLDLYQAMKCSLEGYIEILYRTLLQRLISFREKDSWLKKAADFSSDDFKQMLYSTIRNSPEGYKKNSKIKNNIFGA